jgi:hypothetical protein
MTAKSKSAPAETVTETAANVVDIAGTAMSEAAERGQAALQTALNTWSQEAETFYGQMASQGSAALAQLQACKSPLEVLNVEQAWLAARSKAYLDSGLRFAQAFAQVARGLSKDSSTPPA